MNIKNIINDYVECNNFEIKIKDGKVKIYYYDTIDHFSNNKIIILKNKENFIIEGENLIIETMFDNLIVVGGKIKKIVMG